LAGAANSKREHAKDQQGSEEVGSGEFEDDPTAGTTVNTISPRWARMTNTVRLEDVDGAG
jgi:hypothetical protein